MGKNELPPDFGARLRAARGYMDLTVGQMASRLGKNRSTVRNWELGQVEHDALKLDGLIRRYAELSGLPESFFSTPDLTQLYRPAKREAQAIKKARQARRAIHQGRDKSQADDETPQQKAAGSQ